MGKIVIFTFDDCPFCKRAKELLSAKGAAFEEISITKNPEWHPFLFVLSKGNAKVPQIFFNGQLIGGSDDLQRLEDEGQLEGMLKDALASPGADFPPPLKKPSGDEFLEVLPKELREKWQKDVDALNAKLGGTNDKPISSLLLMLETPTEMVVVCTAGPGKAIYTVGAAGEKGHEGNEEKLYCQVAIEKKQTLFIDDPTKFPGLEKNEDYVKFGYGYYVGAPWVVGGTRGTIVAMEKQPGILKEEHRAIIESLRDEIERDLLEFRKK
jgi:glutaredoxin 3